MKENSKDLRKIVLPLLASRIPEISFFPISAFFLGNYEGKGIEAIGGAVVFFMIIDAFAGGWSYAKVQNKLSEQFGGKNKLGLKHTFHYAVFVSILLSIFFFILAILLFPIGISLSISNEMISSQMLDYLLYRAFGIPFIFITYVLVAFLTSNKNTKYIPFISTLQVGITIFLNYVLVSGNLGFEEMGIRGTAISTLISEFVGVLAYSFLVFLLYSKEYGLLQIGKIRLKDTSALWEFNYAIRETLSTLFWYLFYAIVTNTGQDNASVSNITKAIFSFIVFSLTPFKSALRTLINISIGEKKFDKIPHLIKITFFWCFLSILLSSLLIAFYAEHIAILFLGKDKIHLAPMLIKCIYTLCFTLPFISPFAHITIASLNAFSKDKLLRNNELLVSSLYVGFAYFLANILKQPIHIVWLAEPLYSLLNFIFLFPFLFQILKKYKGIQP